MPEEKLSTLQKDLCDLVQTPWQANQLLQKWASEVHLISPATTCSALPPGVGVVFSAIWCNPDVRAGDVYPVGGGKIGLHKHSLERIAAAAGVWWDFNHTCRMDDRSHPHYCEYRAVGYYRAFDGRIVPVSDTKVMDLRDGSSMTKRILSQAKEGKNPQDTLTQMRANILEHAITKAKLRAIRGLGVRTSYYPDQLQKPFLVVNTMFTGHSENPALEEEAFREQMAAANRAKTVLYGPDVVQAPVLHSPPPLAPPAEPAPKPPAESPPPADATPRVPFGRMKGTPLTDLTESQLAWYVDYYLKRIEAPSPQHWKDKNLQDLEMFREERERRQGPYDEEDATGPDDR